MADPLHKDLAEKLEAVLAIGVSDEAMKALKKSVDQILYDIESDLQYRMKDELAPSLVAFVCDMAEHTVKAIVEGNDGEMRRYLGCERGHWNGRSDGDHGYGRVRDTHEWHPIIHGELFEQGAVKLRRDMALAHRDLITSERIIDLEDQVKSLTAQVNKAISEKNAMWERARPYL